MPEYAAADYSIYLVQCGDGSLYTGIARDVDARFEEHRGGGRGARYLRGRGPLRLVYQRAVGDRSRAQRLEYRVRKLPRPQKLALIAGDVSLDELAD
jgi:putative endonuclease